MRRSKQIRYAVVSGVLGAAVLCGGTAAASDYPPSDTTVTTVAVGGVSAISPTQAASPNGLPATGANSDTTLKVAGGAVVAGAGLLVAAKLRRRSAPA